MEQMAVAKFWGLMLLAVFVSGCATVANTPDMRVENDPLYDGKSPVTFENVFTADEGVDYTVLGDAELGKGELDKALFAYLKALDGAADKATVYFKIGSIHRTRGNSELAEKAFNKVLESKPNDTAALQTLGLIHLKARNYTTARQYFDSAIKSDKKRFVGMEKNDVIPAASNEEILQIKSDISRLKKDLRETLEYRSELYGQVNSLGNSNGNLTRFDSKIAALNIELATLLEDFTEDHPDAVLVKSQLTQLEAKRDQLQSQPQSVEQQEKSAKIKQQLAQSNDKAKQAGTQLRAKQEALSKAEAVTMQKAAVEPYDQSSPVWAYNGLGILADLNGDYEVAIELYQKASHIRLKSAQINNNLGYSYYLANNWTFAEKYFRRALNYNPNYERTWRNLGLLYTRTGRYEDALMTLNRVMEKSAAYNSMGYLCMLQGKHDEADQFFDKAIELTPSYYELAYENKDRNKLLRSRSIAKESKENDEQVIR